MIDHHVNHLTAPPPLPKSSATAVSCVHVHANIGIRIVDAVNVRERITRV